MEKDSFIKIETKLDTSSIDTHHGVKTSSSKILNTKDPYTYLEPDDPHRHQTDTGILRTGISLKESVHTVKEKSCLMALLLRYKKAFSLRDKIGECPNIKANIQAIDNSAFFVRPFKISEEDKTFMDNRWKDLFLWVY